MNVRTIAARMTARGLTLALLVAAFWSPPLPAFGGITNADLVVPEPARTIPTPGVAYPDPAFGTPTVRIADSKQVSDGQMVPEYSQLQAWNADMSLLMLNTGDGTWIVDAQTMQRVHTLDCAWPAFCQGVRWSTTEPLVLYHTGQDCTSGSGCATDDDGQTCGNASNRYGVFRRYQLVRQSNGSYTRTRHLIYCATEYASIDKDRSFEELSEDGRYVALVGVTSGGIYETFPLDIQAKTRGPAHRAPAGRSPDWVAMSPHGDYVLIQWGKGAGTGFGLEAFHRTTMQLAGKVSTASGHGDLTRDAGGQQWFVQTNANNADLFTDAHYIIKAKIPNGIVFSSPGVVDRAATESSGASVRLVRLDWEHNIHISCRNTRAPGWCTVSTSSDGSGYANGWQPFEDEVFRVFLDSRHTSPHVDRVAHHRSSSGAVAARDGCSGRSNYWAQPHSTNSPDGTKIIFGSNWRRICDTSDPVDAFILTIGAAGTPPNAPTNVRVR